MTDDWPRDPDSGRFDESVSTNELLSELRERDAPTPTKVLADSLDVSARTVRRRLNALLETGESDLVRIDAGKAYVWHLSDADESERSG